MEDRQKIIAKLVKIKALAERGIGEPGSEIRLYNKKS